MIDLVVPYVDFQDENWLKTAKENGISPSITRFRGQGDFFKYFFRCVDKNLSWINNIYLLVQSESQVPQWIDKTKVKVILHEDFIPKEFLPTFNSSVIEIFLHNIKELSEQFLYFNDDMYVMKELKPSDFFENGKVKQRFYPNIPEGIFGDTVRNGFNLIFHNESELMPDHSIKPLLKSKYKECFDIYEKEIYKSISKTRESKNISIFLYIYYLKKNGLCEDCKITFKYVNRYNYHVFNLLKYCQIICLNDDIEDYNIYEDNGLIKEFEKRFSIKSKYEK